MKTTFLFFALSFLIALTSNAQTIGDNLNWVSTSSVTTATSGQFSFCNNSSINYTVASPEGFKRNTYTNGIVMPGNIYSTTGTVSFSFSFSQEVCNLRIHIVDLDGLSGSGESIGHISPVYTSLTSLDGCYAASLNSSVQANADNASAWLEWSGPVSGVSFEYLRPGSGYGLIIDSISFECCQRACECRHSVDFKDVGTVSNDGTGYSLVSVSSNGVAVRSISIDLSSYVSTADKACKLCDANHQEAMGTILHAQSISGTAAQLSDPFGLGYARKVTWNFATPTVVSETIQLDLLFPAVVDLSCCKNTVKYCLDVTFVNEDCTACEYTICSNEKETAAAAAKSDVHTNAGKSSGFRDASDNAAGFLLTPNPSDGKVEVTLSDESLMGGKLSVLTTSGIVINSSVMSGKRQVLDLSKLASGQYVVSIEKNGKTSTQTLIIR